MSEVEDKPQIALTEYDRELVRKAAFGMDVEDFIHSPVGDYLFSLATETESKCDRELRRVDPTDVRSIVNLQVRARACGFLKEWLLAAVQAGIDAQREAESAPE